MDKMFAPETFINTLYKRIYENLYHIKDITFPDKKHISDLIKPAVLLNEKEIKFITPWYNEMLKKVGLSIEAGRPKYNVFLNLHNKIYLGTKGYYKIVNHVTIETESKKDSSKYSPRATDFRYIVTIPYEKLDHYENYTEFIPLELLSEIIFKSDPISTMNIVETIPTLSVSGCVNWKKVFIETYSKLFSLYIEEDFYKLLENIMNGYFKFFKFVTYKIFKTWFGSLVHSLSVSRSITSMEGDFRLYDYLGSFSVYFNLIDIM